VERYGMDARDRMGMRDFAGRGRGAGAPGGGRGAPRPFGGAQSAGRIGGMRSDAGATRWDRFPGEEGWFGQGYAGYAGGDVRGGPRAFGGGYDAAFRGRQDRSRGERAAGEWQPSGGRGAADRVRARHIMTDDPECVTPDTSIAEVAEKMRDLGVGIIPVVESLESRRLRGVVTDRDLAVRVLAAGKDGKAKVGEYMTEQLEVVNQNDTVHAVLDVMRRDQVRRVPVTDREGRLVGVIAQADLAVDYAGLDLHRETEVEEAIERISEPAHPRR
jgi:CBS domain-containing protein